MSWDIVIFSSKQKIQSIEEIDEEMFVPIDFCGVLDQHFDNIKKDENHREILGESFTIDYFVDDEAVGNKMFSLYGKNALFELIRIAKIYGWQIFDTGNGGMIDLEHPERNSYEDFQKYLQHVLTQHDNENRN
jgi:hypothetical protein